MKQNYDGELATFLRMLPAECDSKCFFNNLFSEKTFEQIGQICFFV